MGRLAGIIAQADASVLDQFAWAKSLIIPVLAFGMVVLLIYLVRPTGKGGGRTGFTISVDGPEVVFKGRLPEHLEGMVEEFLVEDCRIQGAYEVRGVWEENLLLISVRGEAAKPYEQRIRNFLKLHVKRVG